MRKVYSVFFLRNVCLVTSDYVLVSPKSNHIYLLSTYYVQGSEEGYRNVKSAVDMTCPQGTYILAE